MHLALLCTCVHGKLPVLFRWLQKDKGQQQYLYDSPIPRPLPFFFFSLVSIQCNTLTLFRFCVLYQMQTEEQKAGEAWERGYL